MGFFDGENMFSFKQPLVTGDSVNIVDAGPPDLGRGSPFYLRVLVSSGATGDLTINLKTAEENDMSKGRILANYIIPKDLVVRGGEVLKTALPTGCQRFLGLSYSGATGGTITAGLVLD